VRDNVPVAVDNTGLPKLVVILGVDTGSTAGLLGAEPSTWDARSRQPISAGNTRRLRTYLHYAGHFPRQLGANSVAATGTRLTASTFPA
jgi:hypothetical protein